MAVASETNQKDLELEDTENRKMTKKRTATIQDEKTDQGKHLGQYKGNYRSIQLHPENNPNMCLSYSADGMGLDVTTCENTPEHYWLIAGAQAVERANADSGMAGSDSTKLEATEQAVPQGNTPVEKPSNETTKKETTKLETTPEETTKKETTKVETTKKETTPEETTKVETTQNEITQNETTKVETTPTNPEEKTDTVSKFQGHIGLDGFRFKLTFMDLIFLLLLLFVFYYLL